MSLRDATQELVELGIRGTAFRVGWELRGRAGLLLGGGPPVAAAAGATSALAIVPEWVHRLPLEDAVILAEVMRERIPASNLQRLRRLAEDAISGRVLCFGRWTADYGRPIDWHRDSATGAQWSATSPGKSALAPDAAVDVKYIWEVARFPHAYHIARAAAFFPEDTERYAAALVEQFTSFVERNPVGYGIHWASGQEVGFRLLAWLFALDALLLRTRSGTRARRLISQALIDGATHIEQHLSYARIAVYNNHLLSEALALFAAGVLLPHRPEAARWRAEGRTTLDKQADRQFYDDGGYIQQSHNYHRVALQDYLWACAFARALGDSPSQSWLDALGRSLDLLLAHQNPADGRLPNYGANDGALPSVLTTCDFSDFRGTLQTASLLVRGERIYDPGPWDEKAAWFLGVRALDAPLRHPERRSVSFPVTGYHVLRGTNAATFSAFRCGTLQDRFSQIDMLHLDVWWRGVNVLVDPGSFRYNAAPEWHDHFMRTASHNTVSIDGLDQMLHYRQFKVLYWTKARLLQFADSGDWAICEGEHYGYRRHPGNCVHRRAVLLLKDDLWIVVDQVTGLGDHDVRLHWLGGDFPWVESPEDNGMDLRTPQGVFSVRTFSADGRPLTGDVVSASTNPPRGWLSRYYGEKVAVPSYAVLSEAPVPWTAVTVLAGVPYALTVEGSRWHLDTPQWAAAFDIIDGRIVSVARES